MADLLASFEFYLDFGVEKEAICEEDAGGLLDRLAETLWELNEEKEERLSCDDPVEQFLRYLRAALISGRAHLSDRDGNYPGKEEGGIEPNLWGWKSQTILVPQKTAAAPPAENSSPEESGKNSEQGEAPMGYEERFKYTSQGPRVGYHIHGSVYLLPEPALAAAQKEARDCGDYLSITNRTLGKKLAEKGLLLTQDDQRGRHTTRFRVPGGRLNGLHLSTEAFIMPAPSRHSSGMARFREPAFEEFLDDIESQE